MDAKAIVKLPVSDVARHVTINIFVTGLKMYKIRMEIGLWLIRLAVAVMGMNLKVFELDGESPSGKATES